MYKIILLKKPDLNKYKSQIWNLMEYSYSKIGGPKTYPLGYSSFYNSCKYARIAINDNDKVIATAIYRQLENGSYKILNHAADGSIEGKKALHDIVNQEINSKIPYYWVEVSGAMIYIFLKEGGVPIPNTFTKNYLELCSKKINNLKLLDDGFYYERELIDGTKVKKIIFGFYDKEVYEKIRKEYNLDALISDAKKLVDFKESEEIKRKEECQRKINTIEILLNDENVNELFPEDYKDLKNSVKYLKSLNSNDDISDDIELGKYLLKVEEPLNLICVN